MSDPLKTLRERKHWVIRGDAFDLGFSNYFYSKGAPTLTRVLHEKNKGLDTDEISYRVINHWESEGLLNFTRSSDKGWRKYSIIDLFWIKIIVGLREFGYPLELIKIVKNNLSRDSDTHGSDFPILEYYINLAFSRIPCLLLVFENGEAEPVTHTEYRNSLDLHLVANCLQLSLNRIAQSMLPYHDLSPKSDSAVSLSREEAEIVYLIRTSEFKEVLITGKNGKIEKIDVTEEFTRKEKLVDLIHAQKYQDITIVVADGKIVSTKRKIKKRL